MLEARSAVLTHDRSSGAWGAPNQLDSILREVGKYCDIHERLTVVPPSAKVRGVYCRSIDAALREAGQLERYRAMFPDPVGTLNWHPLGDFLIRLCAAGTLLTGNPERVKEGIARIGRHNALEFARSLLGRMLMRLLSNDPRKLLMQGVAGRRQTCSYGSWSVTFPDERSAVVSMTEEYLWLDSFCFGAALGTFEAIGLDVEASYELETPFSGRHYLRW